MKSWSFSKKIQAVALIWSILSIVVGIFIYENIRQLLYVQTRMNHSEFVIESFNALLNVTVDMETGIRGYLLSGDDAYLEPFSAAEGLFGEQQAKALDFVKEDPAQMSFLNPIMEAKKTWIEGPAVEEMMARKKMSRGMITNEQFVQTFKSSRGKELTDVIRHGVRGAIKLEQQRVEEVVEVQKHAVMMVKYSVLVGLSSGMIIGFALLSLITRRLAAGVGQRLSSLNESTEQMFGVSGNLADSSQKLSEVNSDLSSSIEHTAHSVSDINAVTMLTTKNIGESKGLTALCLKLVSTGQVALEKVVKSIRDISQSHEHTATGIKTGNGELEEIIKLIAAIDSKAQVIHQIVFQTKLLAFNAAVEAARAGEHGRGFSVVAEEVGSLANMSGAAASEISQLLTSSVSRVKHIIENSQQRMALIASQGREYVAAGKQTAEECSVVFKEILESVEQLSARVSDISDSSVKQSEGVGLILNEIENLKRASTDNFDASRETAALSQHVSHQAEVLKQTVHDLGILLEGSAFEHAVAVEPVETENVVQVHRKAS